MNCRRRRVLLTAVSVVVTGGMALGCGAQSDRADASGSQETAAAGAAETGRFSAVWHDGPHLDVMSPLGTFVRAYVEDAGWAFSTWDAENLSRSVIEASAFDIKGQLESEAPSGRRPQYQGAADYQVAEASGPPERTEITVCRTDHQLGSEDMESGEGIVTRAEGEPPSVRPFLLVVSLMGEPPLAGMTGTENVPPPEAFGDWRALRYDHTPLHAEGEEAQRKCNALSGLPAGYPDSPPELTTVPSMSEVAPSPGWPVGSAAAGDF